jgi:hypothetical protein
VGLNSNIFVESPLNDVRAIVGFATGSFLFLVDSQATIDGLSYNVDVARIPSSALNIMCVFANLLKALACCRVPDANCRVD